MPEVHLRRIEASLIDFRVLDAWARTRNGGKGGFNLSSAIVFGVPDGSVFQAASGSRISVSACAGVRSPRVGRGRRNLFVPIPIYGTVWIITVALVTRFLPRSSRMIQTAMLQLDDGLIEAARTTGARPATVTRTVLLPLLRPALLKCWLWVFASALGELPIALLLTTSADNQTLVVLLWDKFTSRADYPQASAVAVLIMLISVVAVWVVNRRSSSSVEGL